MEQPDLPSWTLNARREGDQWEFCLGDGRRQFWRSSRPVRSAEFTFESSAAADLVGPELAERLAESGPRVLNIQYERSLDEIAWETLDLGSEKLAERFAIGRQLLSTSQAASVSALPLADVLSVSVVCGEVSRIEAPAQPLSEADLHQAWACQQVQASQVVVLDGVAIEVLMRRARLAGTERLLVTEGWQAPAQLDLAQDAGAAVLCLMQASDRFGDTLGMLLSRLRLGASVGEAVRWLHRRAGPERLQARLYGDPSIRFVRAPAPTVRRQVTSLSFDLVGSTVLLQELGDEAYAEALDQLHTRCRELVRRHGGQPNDPQGSDGFMCYFGHPAALENAALRAVEAGLAITRAVAALGASVRVGIATGPVAVLAEQPVGLSIHLAARLQQAAQAGTVLAAESTRRLVSHAFELQRLPVRPALKGIAADEDCYVVSGVRRDIGVPGLERPSSQTPLVGRGQELLRLHQCWLQTRAGECRLVLIQAEAGMGKSRLVREFRHEIGRSGVRVLECRCRAEASASPFLTLSEALRRWLDIGEQEPASASLRKLVEALPDASRQAEPLGLLAELLSITAQAPQVPPAPKGAPGRQRQRLLGLLLDWFANFARDRTCCLVVEDWHWVDPSMREFVEQLARRSDGPGLLVAITSRPEAVADACALARPEQIVQIALGGLPPEAARELVAGVCRDRPLPSSVVRQLAARGDGVPLFLEEATRMALELGDQGGREGAGALQAVPASLHDLLMARLDGLGAARAVAQVAAVLGREFALDMLAALLEASGTVQDGGTLRERVALLVRSGLVRAEGEGHFAFKHALIRDVAYGSLWARVRRDLHAHVVALLQGPWAELGAQRPELLALHQTEAGHHRDALAQWERAASKAAARSAEFEAISHLRQALAVLAQTEAGRERDRTALRLQLLLASRLLATEGYGAQAVLQAYRDAEQLCNVIGDETARFKVEMGLEAYRFMRADFEPALAHGQSAAAIAENSGDIKQRLHAHWGLACTLFHQGRLRATMREMDAALSLYTPALHRLFGIQDPGVMCMAYSSWGLWESGRPDAALSRINQAAEIAGAFEHKFSQAVALAYGVSVELLRGETEAALARVARCIAVCDDAGFPVWLAIARCMRGHLLCVQGEFDTGLAEMRAGYALWLSTGAKVSQPLYLALQAEGLMLAGQHAAAAACVDEGLAIVSRYGERQLEAELWRLRAANLLQRGARGEAEHAFKRAYALALRQHRLGFALRSATALAGLWAEDGRHARARRLLRPLTARWTEGLHTRDVRNAQQLCDTLS